MCLCDVHPNYNVLYCGLSKLYCTCFIRYFSIYDGDSREKLLEAYSNDVRKLHACTCIIKTCTVTPLCPHSQAVFSLAVAMQPAGR